MIELGADAFPSFESSVRAKWAPVFLSPIRGSEERLVIGVTVISEADFHIEAANALERLQCLYGSQADIVIQVAAVALDELRLDLAARAAEALLDFRPSISGVSLGDIREGQGESLKSIAASWMTALSSLYDPEVVDLELEALDSESPYEDRFLGMSSGERLSKLVLSYVVSHRSGLEEFFRPELTGKKRRRRSHEVSIDFSGSHLVANFGILQIGQISRSVDIIKRRLWDLKVDRDSEKQVAFQRRHEMLIQMPAQDDPQLSERQFANLEIARQDLEAQADKEELRLAAFNSVSEIGSRVLQMEKNV